MNYCRTRARGGTIPTRWLGRCVVVSGVGSERFVGKIGGFVFNTSFDDEIAGHIGLIMVFNFDDANIEYCFVGVTRVETGEGKRATFLKLEGNCADFFVVSGHCRVKDEVHTVMSQEVSDDCVEFGHFEESDAAEPLDGSNRMRGVSKFGPVGLEVLNVVEGGPHFGDLLKPVESFVVEW